MLERLPKKFSVKWLGVYTISLIVSGLAMVGAVALAGTIAGQEVFEFNMLLLFFFASIANFIVCLFGFFNGKHIFLLSSLAVLIGAFASALLVTEDYNGWEYFSGVMTLVLYTLFGIVTGTIVEIVLFIKNKKKTVEDEEDNLENKTTKWSLILTIIYVVLLSVPVLISLSALEPAADKSEPIHGGEVMTSSFSINYTEGNAEYLEEIFVTKDMIYQ